MADFCIALQFYCLNLCCGRCADCCGSCWSVTTCGFGSEYICYDLCRVGSEPDDWSKVKTAVRPGEPGYIDPENPFDHLKIRACCAGNGLGEVNALPMLPLRINRELV